MPVMRHYHQRTVKFLQGFCNRFTHLDIEVIGRFVEQQQIRFLPDDQSQRKPGFFATRKRRDAGVSLLTSEVKAAEEIAEFLLARAGIEPLHVLQR